MANIEVEKDAVAVVRGPDEVVVDELMCMVPMSPDSFTNGLAPFPPMLLVLPLLLFKLVLPTLMLPPLKPEPLKLVLLLLKLEPPKLVLLPPKPAPLLINLVLLPPKVELALLLLLLFLSLFLLSSSGREGEDIAAVLFDMAPGAGAEEALADQALLLFPAAAYPTPQSKKFLLSIVLICIVGLNGRNKEKLWRRMGMVKSDWESVSRIWQSCVVCVFVRRDLIAAKTCEGREEGVEADKEE